MPSLPPTRRTKPTHRRAGLDDGRPRQIARGTRSVVRARGLLRPERALLVRASIVSRGPASRAARPGCACRQDTGCSVAGPKGRRPLPCVVPRSSWFVDSFFIFFQKKNLIRSLIIHPDYSSDGVKHDVLRFKGKRRKICCFGIRSIFWSNLPLPAHALVNDTRPRSV
jgi:hypothetical protein